MIANMDATKIDVIGRNGRVYEVHKTETLCCFCQENYVYIVSEHYGGEYDDTVYQKKVCTSCHAAYVECYDVSGESNPIEPVISDFRIDPHNNFIQQIKIKNLIQ